MNAVMYKLPAGIKFNMAMEGRRESVGEVMVTIRKNLCFFDGTIKMDGSRLFNSVKKEEEL